VHAGVISITCTLLAVISPSCQMPVPLTSSFVNSLAKSSGPGRPDFRRREAELDPDSRFGFVMPDLTVFPNAKKPTICVEIKVTVPSRRWSLAPLNNYFLINQPKAGYLPQSDYISGAHMIKKQICRYCMYQRLKFKKGEVEKMRYKPRLFPPIRSSAYLFS